MTGPSALLPAVRKPRARWAGGLVALAVLGGAGGRATADVFEIANNGTVVTRSGASMIDPGLSDDAVTDGTAEPAPDVPAPAVTMVGLPNSPLPFRTPLLEAARRYEVSPDLLAALVWQESRWQPGALSAKGAMGLGQLMPATARALAVDPRDAGANLAGAAHYLRQLLDLFDGDVERALAAYNAGPARVLKAGGVPRIAETRAYVSAIMERLTAVRAESLAGIQP